MSEFPVVTCLSELELLNSNEIVEGYLAGFKGDPEPGSDKSKSYWHGWRNGHVDGGHGPIDHAQCELAREFVHRQKVKMEFH